VINKDAVEIYNQRQKVVTSLRGRPVKYDRDFLLAIPTRLENGASFEQIAAEANTSPRLLMQTCRRNNVFSSSDPPLLRLPIEVELRLRKKADELGISPEGLASKLLEIICKEDLFGAVLD